ncbi:MAG: HAMP domain-containing histidine kinase [Deltaproteobacteria bacterium]|nr:HAMP domain-containing histidine kinase [Deltaproteobacteria bacterium]
MQFFLAFNRLKTVIMTSLAFLILSAMLLTYVVTAKLAERDLIDAHVDRGRLLLKAIKIVALDEKLGKKVEHAKGLERTIFARHALSLLQMSAFSGILIRNRHGLTVFSHGDLSAMAAIKNDLMPLSSHSIRVDFSGKTWGLFWRAPRYVVLAWPLQIPGGFQGSLYIFSGLGPIYKKIRASEPVILAYIAMNALILVLFGIYLLSRTVVRPINRLVAVTERFDGDIPVLEKGESPNNEIGQLSQSLNRMLRQLDANERKLKENIVSLEAANREVRRAQNEMVASEKMASVGLLATGVAHEIGNPLGIMLGYIELLQREDLTALERKDFLQRMETEMTRIHRIIRDLLDFSRPSTGDEQLADAHETLEEVLAVIGPQPLFEKVHIERTFHANAVTVKIAKDLLKQVFFNIIINAADAMAGKRNFDGNDSQSILTIESFNEGESLIMTFSDTGCGVSPEDLKHIFDPFFTTKSPGKGTGLGLSICYTIIDRTGGRISVESESGTGTTVILEIPVYNNEDEETCCAKKPSTGH